MKSNLTNFSFWTPLALAIGISLTGCGRTADETSNQASRPNGAARTLSICCTTNIVKDLVQQIGGEHVTVTAIMDGPAVDPHVYAPSPQDINLLTASDVVVFSGLHLEAQFDDALQSLGHRGIPTIRLTKILETEHADRLLKSHGVLDPHVWFDLELWAYCGNAFAEQLAEIDAVHAADFRAAAEKFAQQLRSTRDECQTLLADIPEDRRILVTAHDAFQYFARAHNFRVEAIQGISTESEPGLKRINQLSRFLADMRIGAIFTEQSVSDRSVGALIAACRSLGHDVAIGGRLYSDTAGAAGTPEETLSGAVRHNVREIAAALRLTPITQVQP